jgi:hypothetical protein
MEKGHHLKKGSRWGLVKIAATSWKAVVEEERG